jgi:hypothetical protein
MSRLSEEGKKKESHRNWNPWHIGSHIGSVLGTGKPSSEGHCEGHSSSGMCVRSMRTWDVKMPPTKKHMVGGHLVPNLIGKVQFMSQKTRRISIEIHGPPKSHLGTPHESPISQTMMQGLLRDEKFDSDLEKESLQNNEAVFFRVLKEAKGSHRYGHGNDDSSTESSVQGSHHAGTYTIDEY